MTLPELQPELLLGLPYALTHLILTVTLQAGVLRMRKLRNSEVTFITQVSERERT